MTTIPLNKLVPAKHNVRKSGGQDAIEELAASIAAHGLLTSLTVRKAARGQFTVVAGQRRYSALTMLAAQDRIPADMPVLCQVIDRDADVTEIGLAENVVRLAMHPADQFEAFRALIDKGADAADIATRFGVSEATVARRLKLGRVSPVILDAYRAGELSLDQVQAFALSDDQAAQERIWAQTGRRCHPAGIRRALTEGEIPSTDPRLCFIGLAAYEAAGGTVRRDLFDEEGGGYVQDAALLDQLVLEKLEALVETVRTEGWKWIQIEPAFDYEARSQFRHCQPKEIELPDAEAAELERLRDEHEALLEAEYAEETSDEAADTDRLAALEERIQELEDKAYAWTPELMAKAGAVIHLSSDGDAEVERGLIRPEDEPEQDDVDEDADASEAERPAPSLPATLIADLTAQKTAALRTMLAQQPAVALAAVTHALARRAFYRYGGETCLQIAMTQRSLATPIAQPDACSGLFMFDAERGRWAERLPADVEDLWSWCLEQTQETLLDLLAVSAAHAVDAVREKSTREDCPRLAHADALAQTLKLDMQDWFTPTAANYFSRVTRTFIIGALTEAGLPARTRSWAKLKKTELAALAERELHGNGWLPQPLRSIGDVGQADTAHDRTPAEAAA